MNFDSCTRCRLSRFSNPGNPRQGYYFLLRLPPAPPPPSSPAALLRPFLRQKSFDSRFSLASFLARLSAIFFLNCARVSSFFARRLAAASLRSVSSCCMSARAFFSSPLPLPALGSMARFCMYVCLRCGLACTIWELGGEGAGHLEGVEAAVLALDGAVLRVLLLRRREALVAADLAGEAHGLPPDEVGDGVVEAARLDGVPGAEEDNVAKEDLVLEGGAEVALGLGEGALDLPADAGDGLDGGALEFCNFERRGEHVLDEGGVFENLVRRAGELELLDNLGRLVDGEHSAGGGDAEAWRAAGHGVEGDEAAVGRDEGRVDGAEAVHVLGCVLEHAVARARVRDGVDGQRLEAPPPERQDERVVGLENLAVPPVPLDAHLHKAPAVLCRREPAHDDGQPRVEARYKLGRHPVEHKLGVPPRPEAFHRRPLLLVELLVRLLVDVELLLDRCFLRVVPVVLAKLLLRVAAFAPRVGLVVEEPVAVLLLESLPKLLLAARILLPLRLNVLGGGLHHRLGLAALLGLEIFKLAVAFAVLVSVRGAVPAFPVAVVTAAAAAHVGCGKPAAQSLHLFLICPLGRQILIIVIGNIAVFDEVFCFLRGLLEKVVVIFVFDILLFFFILLAHPSLESLLWCHRCIVHEPCEVTGVALIVHVLIAIAFALSHSHFALSFATGIFLLLRHILDGLSALEELQTLVCLAEKSSLTLKTDDHFFTLATLPIILSILIKCKALFFGDPDSVTVNFQAAAIRHGSVESLFLLV
ncbi:hypothetical protein BM221_008433 [Beauveria bassiana]|uniref:Uncharacterized protein n=1 Tax=Beauveria bassiana TaxID=176275 RepID=A0A2N6NG52_BEABA|nr:hypothetical protein BM221_008433 [Beauveria bassiana]